MLKKFQLVGFAIGVAMLSLTVLGAGNTAADALTTLDEVFSEVQVERGHEAYMAHCASCHGGSLLASDSNAPDLTGPTFQYNWIGKSVGERFDKIRSTMPLGRPNSLPVETYLDIVVFVLNYNGVPHNDSDAELSPDDPVLHDLLIAVPPTD